MILVIILTIIVYVIFVLISFRKYCDKERRSRYECGFNLINKVRIVFSYRFFLIRILFLIFDVEIILILSIPFLLKSEEIILVTLMFLIVLILGLVYEYYWGSLEWINVSKA